MKMKLKSYLRHSLDFIPQINMSVYENEQKSIYPNLPSAPSVVDDESTNAYRLKKITEIDEF